MVGEAAEVVQERISDDELILIKGLVSLFLILTLFYLNSGQASILYI